MSVTDNPASKLDSDSDSGSQRRSGRPVYARPVVLGAGLLVVAVAVAGTVWATGREETPKVTLPRTAPITLPATLDGLSAVKEADDFSTQSVWRDKAEAAAPGVTVSGRSYGSVKERRQIRVVAGRADLKGKLEFAWPVEAGRVVESAQGEARCSRNLRLVERGTARVQPTMVFCWRTSAALSAYGVVIDFDKNPTDAQGLAALDVAWTAALTGR
jgi:hypothetical protein